MRDPPQALLAAPRSAERRVGTIRYELFMDDLPIWGFVGEFVEAQEETADMPKAEESARAAAPRSPSLPGWPGPLTPA